MEKCLSLRLSRNAIENQEESAMDVIYTLRRPGQRLWQVCLASAVLLIGLLRGLAIRSSFATPAGNQTIQVCVNRFTGQARFILPGQLSNCTTYEAPIAWTSASGDTPAVKVSENSQAFTIPAGLTVTQNVSCPNAGQIPISGGGSANHPVDIPLLVINQSFRRFDDPWRVSMTNLDESMSHDAVAHVLCIPAN
jgi:hypothetical protein